MTAFYKLVQIGIAPAGKGIGRVFCEIEIKEDGRLSITGVEGPKSNGDCLGGCGQIEMHISEEFDEYFTGFTFAEGWDIDKARKFFDIWDRWHLNDMRGGSPAQEQWLRDNPIARSEYAYPKNHYDVASEKLAMAGLNPDPNHGGYKYGHAWLKEEVPADVIDWLKALPDSPIGLPGSWGRRK